MDPVSKRCKSQSRSSGRGWTLSNLLLKMLLAHLMSSDFSTSAHHQESHHVTFAELEALDAACHPRDICNGTRVEDNLEDFNCNCDAFCVDYDTCCLDSPFRILYPKNETVFGCTREYRNQDFKHLFMVDRCRSDWTGDDYVREMCSGDAEALGDPLLFIPFSDNQTQVTYRNYFCLICNDHGDGINGVFWNVNLTSNLQIFDTKLTDLIYDSSAGKWGIRNGSDHFEPVRVELLRPDGVYLRECDSGIISECDKNWPDDVIREKCASYMAQIYTRSYGRTLQGYRNVHCAICNNEKDFDSLCFVIPSTNYDIKSALSFAHLLDINQSDGDKVGEKKRCKSNELYDPFSKRCRVLQCGLPEYVIKDGSCVKQ